jgi:hypothetical protein
MGLETASYISQLVATNPLATDPISQGDDHLRLIKSVLQTQFSGLSGTTAVTTSEAEMNILDGVTATSTELNYLDITTLGTSEASKAVTADASGDVTIADGAYDFDVASHDGSNGLKLAGTLVTATATELNLIDGYTGTTTELNYNDVTTLGTVEASKTVTADASGNVNFADNEIQRPELKDYAETKTALSAAASVAIDITNGNVFTITPDQNTTFTFTNPSASGKSCAFTLIWTQDSSDRTISWPASVDWAGGSAPDVTSGSGKRDVYTFFTIDAGTIWYGFQAGADMS